MIAVAITPEPDTGTAAVLAGLARPYEPIRVLSALLGLPSRTTRQLVGTIVATSDEAEELLERMPHILRSLAIASTDQPERCYGELLQLYTDIGNTAGVGATQIYLGRLYQVSGRDEKAETMLREAVRLLKRVGDLGHLCEAQRYLAQTLVVRGKVDEAERVALQALETVGPEDQLSIWTTRMALGIVRAAQGRDDEAEQLLQESVAGFVENGLRFAELQALGELVAFLRARGRLAEADAYEERANLLCPSIALPT